MSAITQILKSKEEYFETLINLQNLFFEENNYEDIISFITDKNVVSNKELFLHLLQTIKKCVFIRSEKIELLVSIITFLKDDILREFPRFRWIGNHIPSYLLDDLSKIGVFNLPIRRLGNPNEKTYNTLIKLIKSDDIALFQSTLSHTNTHINTEINIQLYKLDKITSPTLIELASLFGSLQIFKFLFMNNAIKREILAKYALAGGNYEIIHILERENIRFTDISIMTTAIRFHRNDIVEYLDPDPIDVLKYCARYDNIECFLRCLNKIDFKRNLQIDDDFIKVCFHSVRKNYSEVAKILCFLHPDCVNQDDFQRKYMIHHAIENNFNELVKFLCNFPQSDLNVTNGELETPLFIAVRQKNAEIVELLCDNEKVDLNFQNFLGNTAMHVALEVASIQIIQILINHKDRIDTTIKNNQQLTYMHIAIATKNLDIVKLINDLDNNLRLVGNKTNSTPLIYAVSYGTPEIVEFLCSFDNVDVNSKNCHGISSLHLAIENPLNLPILCHHSKIDLNIKNDQGNSPLHLAASKGRLESVKILLSFNGVDINAVNDVNNTPLFLAAENGYLEIVKFLCSQKSIDVKIKNKAGILNYNFL